MNNYLLNGYIPSRFDEKDYKASHIFTGVTQRPEELKPITYASVLDQGSTGMCMAFTASRMVSYFNFKETGIWEDYSYGWIYGTRKIGQHAGEGMMPNEALANLRDEGVPVLSDLPIMGGVGTCNIAYLNNKQKLMPKSILNKIQTYYRCTNKEEIQDALIHSGSVVFGIAVYDQFYYADEETGLVQSPTGKINGYHAILCIGYTKQGWLIQNSWGTEWGKDGFCILPYDYPIMEAWGVTDLPRKPKTVRFFNGNKDVQINGITMKDYMDVPAYIDTRNGVLNGRFVIPIRYVGDALDYYVHWDDKGIGTLIEKLPGVDPELVIKTL